jgi:C-terminal processing protease CtpA/Prc
LVTRAALALLSVNLFVTASAAERGSIGMRLQREGLAWRIVETVPGGPADKAGLRAGEVVVQINNLFLPSEDQMMRLVAGLKNGEVLRISVINTDGFANFDVTVGPPMQ